MKKASNSSIFYKLMARYIFEIILVVAFMIVSYTGFTMNNLSEASEIASLSAGDSRDIQASYARTSADRAPVLEGQELVDVGTFYIKNPNKIAKEMNIVIQLRKSDAYKIGDLNILVDGEEVPMGVIHSLDEIYEVSLKRVSLDAYESVGLDVAIYSLKEYVPLEYSFKIEGSF